MATDFDFDLMCVCCDDHDDNDLALPLPIMLRMMRVGRACKMQNFCYCIFTVVFSPTLLLLPISTKGCKF